MSWLISVIILAVIQGLTEFFPVSSSGHLVLAESFLSLNEELSRSGSILFELAVHVGTLGAVIIFYRDKIGRIVSNTLSWASGGFRVREKQKPELQYLLLLVVGSVPAAIVGLFFRDRISSLFDSPMAASAFLVLTGIFILFGRERGGGISLSWRAALLIGAAQAVAILPGCSRSGWTITAALLMGIGFERAAEYSFLLSIPPIIFGFLLELGDFQGGISTQTSVILITGAVVSFISGYIALKLLLGILSRGSFHRFAYYLLPAGSVAFIYFYLT
ncbi:MAG: undecaprenyl-diphosphatase [Candidatus Latescibacteria bacterium]|nr:undecaprenyl-diphosphatase [bacterium]MBD3424236.1 undecaprenyl-diphosphatase [Candidatus Latescibacterota bacterium]